MPKKIILLIGKKIFAVFDVLVVVERFEATFVIEDEESVFLVFDVVDKKDAIEMVDFMLEDTSKAVLGFYANFLAVFEKGFDFGF